MRMKVILTLAVLLIIGSCDDSEKLVGNPPILVHPCNGTKEIIVTFEPSLSQEENQYRVTINKSFINQSKIEIILDANANVTMSDNDYARVSNQDKSAVINFFKDNNGTTFAIKGFEKVPYITSLIINNEQHCSQPSIGFLDKYIVANKDNASSGSIKSKVNCGRRNLAETKSVLNKTVVKPEEWPWHVTIYRSGDSDQSKYFEGTLISKNFVITVADAVTIEKTPYEPNELSALLLTDGVLYEEIPVKKLYIHDEYDSEYLIHNVALLELKKDVVFNNYIQPVCLWNTPVEIERRSEYKGTVVGYDNKGFLHNHIITSPLQQTSMTIMPRNECVPTGIRYETFFSDKFCAEKSDGAMGCIGDSGSPYQIFVPDNKNYSDEDASGAWYLFGIVQLSLLDLTTLDCDPDEHMVLAFIEKDINWINKIAGNDQTRALQAGIFRKAKLRASSSTPNSFPVQFVYIAIIILSFIT